MGFVLYGGWDGGRAGHGLAVALGWALGRARVLAPVALVVGGGALLLRPVLPALRPLRTGAHLPVRLGHARAGRRHARRELRRRAAGPRRGPPRFLQAHGGVVGEALYQLTHRLVQNVGVDILVVFLLLAGVILLTGASLASALRATGSGAGRHDADGAQRWASASAAARRGRTLEATRATTDADAPRSLQPARARRGAS